jgi:predicted PurR-regulated permease PerM
MLPPAPPSTFYSRVFASVTAIVLGYAVLRIVQPFLAPVLWAGLLAFLLFPANRRLRAAFRGRKAPAALLLTVASILTVVLPAVALGIAFGRQASELVGRLQDSAAQHQIQTPGDVLALPQVDRFVRWAESSLPVSTDQLRESLVNAGQQVVQAAVALGGTLFASVFGLVVSVVLALFLFFFCLRDGERMIEQAMVLVPLDDRRKGRLLDHLANVIKAIVLGSLVTAFAQGTLVGIGFRLAGLPSPAVFGVLAMGAALIPLVGTTVVWVPGALWLGLTGHWGAALFLAIWAVAVVSSADNVIRPLFISSRAKITTLPVFIGLLGGIGAFGPIGIFLGPVVIALVLALVEFAHEAIEEQKAAEAAAAKAAEPAPLP